MVKFGNVCDILVILRHFTLKANIALFFMCSPEYLNGFFLVIHQVLRSLDGSMWFEVHLFTGHLSSLLPRFIGICNNCPCILFYQVFIFMFTSSIWISFASSRNVNAHDADTTNCMVIWLSVECKGKGGIFDILCWICFNRFFFFLICLLMIFICSSIRYLVCCVNAISYICN